MTTQEAQEILDILKDKESSPEYDDVLQWLEDACKTLVASKTDVNVDKKDIWAKAHVAHSELLGRLEAHMASVIANKVKYTTATTWGEHSDQINKDMQALGYVLEAKLNDSIRPIIHSLERRITAIEDACKTIVGNDNDEII